VTQRTREKLSENLILLCKDLGIPYNPQASHNDWRADVIANALTWTANDVEEQCRIERANSRGRNNPI
jgi:hypothetical protein